jgi:hypothetical protein
MGRLCYPTRAPGRVLVPRPASGGGATKLSRCKPACRLPAGRQGRQGRQGGFGAGFCRHGTNFIEHYECRGTSLIGAANLSPVTKLVADTGAVSRHKFDRSKKFITIQNLYC